MLQGTYETFAQVAREHFGGTLRGRLVVTAGLGGMGAAQPLAITRMLEGVCLVAEVDADEGAARGCAAGVVDVVCDDLDEALDAALARAPTPLAIAVTVNAAELLGGRCSSAASPPTSSTDLTAAHDLRQRLPARSGVTLEEAAALRAGDPGKLEALALATMVRHVRAMLALRERGAVVFDYGNNIRPHAAAGGAARGARRSTSSPPATCGRCSAAGSARSAGSACRARTPTSTSLDELCLERSRTCRGSRSWIALARRARRAARGCRRGSPGSATASARGSRWPPTRRSPTGGCAAPVAFTRDHMDGGRDDPPEHHHRGDGRRLRRDQRLAAARRAADHRLGRRPRRAARRRRRLRGLLAERRDDGRRDRHRGRARRGCAAR